MTTANQPVSVRKQVDQLVAMLREGLTMEAFEQLYHPDVMMQEKCQMPTIGKAANRLRLDAFFANLIEFRRLEHLNTTYGHQVTTTEWHYDYTHREWGVCNFFQVAIQHWHNGLIIKEKFYHTR
jgi:1-deoxy-D-xylulose 5-phosphate reductoisomerase